MLLRIRDTKKLSWKTKLSTISFSPNFRIKFKKFDNITNSCELNIKNERNANYGKLRIKNYANMKSVNYIRKMTLNIEGKCVI